MNRVINSEQGSVTILIALLSAVILALGLSFNWLVREHIRTSEGLREKTEAIIKTRSAYDSLIYIMLTGRLTEKSVEIGQSGITDLKSIPLDGSEVMIAEGVRAKVQDSNGRLSLTTPSPDALQRLFKLEAGAENGAMIMESFMDWIDRDELARPNGAEASYYRNQGLPHAPRNYALQYPGELLLIRGMNEDIYRRVIPSLTIMPNSGFNPNTASIAVLKAFLNVDDVRAERIKKYAAEKGIKSLPELVALSGKMLSLPGRENWLMPSCYADIVVSAGAGRSLYKISAGLTTLSGIFYPSFIYYWQEE